MSIYEKLYPWQKNIINKFSDRESFGIWLDMGLGKTPIGLAMAEVNQCTKLLIITINAKAQETEDIKGSWLNWAAQSNIKYEFRNKKSKYFYEDANELLIVNFEALFERGQNKKERVTLKPYIKDFINSCKNHNVAILIDESHKIKDLQSQQTGAIIKIKDSLKRVASRLKTYLLTGTPFTTGYEDIYSQLKMLGWDYTKHQFLEDFCIRGNLPGLFGWQQPIIGYKNIERLFDIIHQYAITIDSSEVADLPEKIFIYHTNEESDDFAALTNEKWNDKKILETFKRHNLTIPLEYMKPKNIKINNPFYRNIDYPDLNYIAETPGNFWLRARELSIGFQGNAEECTWYDRSRLNLLKHFLQTNENNYLLFYNYTPELLEIYNICEELGYNIDVYSGEIKSLTFYEKYCKLSESQKLGSKKNIILANFASGSTGLNWQEYNNCIIFSCPLYKDYAQGIKRIHRLGQKNTTFYHVFYQKNWLDNGMNKALQDKVDYNVSMYESDLKRVEYMTKGEQK